MDNLCFDLITHDLWAHRSFKRVFAEHLINKLPRNDDFKSGFFEIKNEIIKIEMFADQALLFFSNPELFNEKFENNATFSSKDLILTLELKQKYKLEEIRHLVFNP